MNLLFEIYNKIILNETVSTSMVTDSIENKYRVTINYEGDPSHGIAPGPRTIEVYAYGLTKAGNPVIRAYQPYGDTVTNAPDWKFFRLDRVKSWKPTYALINKPAPGFNPSGDRLMSTIYSIADFTTETNPNNITGPKQTYNPIGQLPDFDKIMLDREKEKRRDKEQNRDASRFTPSINKTKEPEIKGSENVKSQKIIEPQIDGIQQIDGVQQLDKESEMYSQDKIPSGKPIPNEQPNDSFKTKGDEELEKVKDLNRRLDNTRKIDLSTIPKK